ncbi:motility protein MotB, partial [Klebsiella pneumoniae]|nr:motility protein MotB [Klebsiella pneumoniae]
MVIKKITVVNGGHHGGAWKVAFADFMTAMMAFFLVMWLLATQS